MVADPPAAKPPRKGKAAAVDLAAAAEAEAAVKAEALALTAQSGIAAVEKTAKSSDVFREV